MSKDSHQICVICGQLPAETRDHVPPKNLFPKPRPPDLITVPACVQCNNGSSVEDEDFRTYLSLQIGRQSELVDKLWLQSKKSLKRRTAFRTKFLHSLRDVEIPTPQGPQQRTTFPVPCRIYEVVFERVVRGLYFHHFGVILGKEVPVKAEPLTGIDDDSFRQIAPWPTYSIGNNAFVYKLVKTDEDPLSSTCVMQLYESHWILGRTGRMIGV